MKKQIRIRPIIVMIFLVNFIFFFESCDLTKLEEEILSESDEKSGKASRESSAIVVDWYNLQLQMILNANPAINPILLGRSFGYMGIGLYESVRPGILKSVSLSEKLYEMPAMPVKENNKGYVWGVSANAALARLVTYFYPEAVVTLNKHLIDSLENAYNNSCQPSMESAVFQRSQNFGRAIADAIIAWSKTDNSNLTNTGYVPPVFPGSWEPTPPAFANAVSPYFGNTRPFLKQHLELLAPPFVHAYSEDPASDFYKMEKGMYDFSQTLTDEQKNIALYWNDGGVGIGYTPPGHSISILTQIVKEEKINLGKAATAYAKTGIALTDAAIACWKSKYKYNLIRPVSYINKVIDPSWTPLLVTPPHPEYPSGHAFITCAFMQALTEFFGKHFSFTDHTYGPKYGGPRTYSSLNDVATECGQSRYYGGIHYQPSIDIAVQMGRQIGLDLNNIELVQRH